MHAEQQGSSHGLSRALIGLPLGKGQDARPLGEVLRALLDGPANVADAALHGINQAKVGARITGTPPALVIVVEAPDDHLTDAETAVTDLLSRIGRGETSDDAVIHAIDEAFAQGERTSADPRQRAVALVTGHAPGASFSPARVDLARFRAWARATATGDRTTTVDIRH